MMLEWLLVSEENWPRLERYNTRQLTRLSQLPTVAYSHV